MLASAQALPLALLALAGCAARGPAEVTERVGSPGEVANWQKLNDGLPIVSDTSVYDSSRSRILMLANGSTIWSWKNGWTQLSTAPFTGEIVDEGGGNLLAVGEVPTMSGSRYLTFVGDGSVWTNQMVIGPPTGGLGLVYDSKRGRAVALVGGTTTTDPLNTWEWDGTQWTQILIAGPTPRASYALTYDSTRGRTVLFGGETSMVSGMILSYTYYNDTWEYDGTSWTQQCTKTPCKNTMPSARAGRGATFDSGRGKSVFFGGWSTGSGGMTSYFGDTWEWDGSVWVQRSTTGPSARLTGVFAYDAALGATVLYGISGTSNDETWTWNGTVWTQQPKTAPSAREMAALAYDSTRQVTVLFGGFANQAGINTTASYGDTWEWNGSSWTLRATTGPSPRFGASVAYDSTRGRTVIYGGQDASGTRVDDTWEWDGSTWHNPATTGPGARAYAAATFDAGRGRTVVFGGLSSADLGDTWEWDGSTWQRRATTGAPARERAGLAYDPAISRSVLMGGWQTSVALGDTWTWDGSTWSPVTTAPSLPRSAPGMVWDTVRKELVLFGGQGKQDTFTGDGTTWTQISTTFPAPRDYPALVYDQAHGRTLLFGGIATYDQSDLWALELSAGGCSADGDCETGHCVDGTCCMVASCGTCQTCNGTSPGTCTAVKNADDPDTCTGTSTCDPNGACKLKLGQGCGTDGTVCASASCSDGVCCNAACTQSCQVCAKSLGATADGTCTTAPAGFTGRPACTAVLCSGNVASCPVNSCNGDAQCAAGYFCAGNGTCQPVRSQGAACNSAAAPTGDCLQAGCRECNTPGGCVDGFCCGSSCGLGCEACDQTPGICTVAPAGRSTRCVSYVCDGSSTTCPASCTGDAQCATGYHCVAGTCTSASGQGLGQTCGSDPQCLSGHCVDGKCCDSTCVGPCHYCDASGHCQAAAPGTDPRGACKADPGCSRGCTAAGTCDLPGPDTRCDVCKACNGSGRCNQPLADDGACGTISCAGLSTECVQYADLTAMRCVGVGVCATENDPTSCTSASPLPDGTSCSSGVCQGGQCAPAPSAGTGGSGASGCAYGGAPTTTPFGLLLLALLAIARRRTT
jgi:hypothetical protein